MIPRIIFGQVATGVERKGVGESEFSAMMVGPSQRRLVLGPNRSSVVSLQFKTRAWRVERSQPLFYRRITVRRTASSLIMFHPL